MGSRAVGTHCSCLRRQCAAAAAKIVAKLARHIIQPAHFQAKIGPKFLYATIYGSFGTAVSVE